MTACDDALASLSHYNSCEMTRDGARIRTHCLYPSFEPVFVYVIAEHAGFYVHDGGGGYRSAWDHGREDRTISNALEAEARRFDIEIVGKTLGVHVSDVGWLETAILSVANGSSHAASNAVKKFVAASESALKQRIGAVLEAAPPTFQVVQDFSVVGQSGKEHKFDFAVKAEGVDRLLLVDAVSPHHSSISHRFVAFADTRKAAEESINAFAVYDRPLDRDDAALIQQVADLVPFSSLKTGAMRALDPHRAPLIGGTS